MKYKNANNFELDKICNLLAEEFNNDPVHEILFPEPKGRIDILRNYFRIYVNLARKRGGTLLTENNEGALVYFRPNAMETTNEGRAILEQQIHNVCGPYYTTVSMYTHALERYHPRTPLHYYIPLIAVQRTSRGKGVANVLFSALHTMADKEKFPCYLECTRLSTRTHFMRWGYRDAGPALRIEGVPELFPMWREPQ